MRIYLSGGMEFAGNRGADWRAELEQRLRAEFSWTVFNPVAESARLLEELHPGVVMRDIKERDPELFRSIVTEIVRLDSEEVAERTDLVVCLWDESAAHGAGTQGEVTLARRYGKPVYLVTTLPFVSIPGWVIGCTTHLFGSFEELMTRLRDGTHRGT